MVADGTNPLKIPAGIVRNGTDFEAEGRWRDANLVRWRQGSLRAIGGWSVRERLDGLELGLSVPLRSMHSWLDNDVGPRLAAGNADKLIALNAGGAISDITPAGLTAGSDSPSGNLGFGGGFYGQEQFGVARQQSSAIPEGDTWSLDNFGQNLIASLTSDGRLFEWDLVASEAQVIANAPIDCKGVFVTEERFVFALQANGDPRKVAWSDREDSNTWTPLDTNEAGDFTLQTNGEIMCATRLRGRSDCYVHRCLYRHLSRCAFCVRL